MSMAAQDLFEHKFNKYSPAMEDYQTFCLRLLDLICPDTEECKNDRTYFYSKSYSRMNAASAGN